MIITIGGIKGGSGKTTTATTLAVLRAAAGREVVLVDADEQGTAAAFSKLRSQERPGGAGYMAVRLDGLAVLTESEKLAAKYEDVIIDTGGRDSASLRAALAASDVVLVPVVPEPYDTWTLRQMAEMVDHARAAGNRGLAAWMFLNRTPPRGGRYVEETTRAAAEQPELTLIPPAIGRRAVFARAAKRGLAVTEYRPRNEKAIAEAAALAAYMDTPAAAAPKDAAA